jgi:major membrane immunogen (membrane-anchored lipoprotein)
LLLMHVAGRKPDRKGIEEMNFESKLTENGISTTTQKDQFQYEEFEGNIRNGKGTWMVQWDYRDANGKLHSGVAKTVEAAKQKAAQFGYKEV